MEISLWSVSFQPLLHPDWSRQWPPSTEPFIPGLEVWETGSRTAPDLPGWLLCPGHIPVWLLPWLQYKNGLGCPERWFPETYGSRWVSAAIIWPNSSIWHSLMTHHLADVEMQCGLSPCSKVKNKRWHLERGFHCITPWYVVSLRLCSSLLCYSISTCAPFPIDLGVWAEL